MINTIGRAVSRLGGRAAARSGVAASVATVHSHRFRAEFRDKDGKLFAVRHGTNLVVNTGLNEILEEFYKGSGYTAAHYIGLTDDSPTIAAGDTESSHAGWTEVTAYTTTDSPAGEYRATFTPGTVSSQSVDNVGNEAVFTTTGSVDVGGFFLSTDQQKGDSPSAGILIGVSAFDEGDVSVPSASTITVTVTATAAAS